MNQFVKFVLASCLGVFLASIVLFFVGIFITAGAASAADKSTVSVESNSVLDINLENQIPDLTNNVENDNMFSNKKVVGVHDLIKAIDHAATDNKIKGIAIHTRFIMGDFSKIMQIRKAIEDFKQKSGKFVYAYADTYSQGAYYVASVADAIYLNPTGDIDFRGFAAEIPFMKDMFDRLDVKWQIYYAGQFKSATEPFRLDKMSDQNRLQIREYLNGLYDNYLSDIIRSRKLPKEDLLKIANGLEVRSASDATRLKLVDTEGYYDEFLGALRQKMGLGENAKIPSISLNDYAQSFTAKQGSSKNKIAVVYAEGDINYSGSSQEDDEMNGTVEGNRYAKILRKLRLDDKVKAIVLRVNSGGGSAVSSEIMWRELDLTRKIGKPVIVSFGDYAASGGYYIACASDSIFAEPATLTGSIGVFSMIPSFQKTFKNKLGVNFDTVKTAAHADGLSVTMDNDAFESQMYQAQTDSLYEKFLNRVATNRRMSRDQVHAIAQGRIWLGKTAVQNGLVDRIGSLQDAIAAAAAKAGLSDYKTTEYPKLKPSFEKFIENITGTDPSPDGFTKAAIQKELGEYAAVFEHFQKMKTWRKPQMRLPYHIRFR
jgi:protease-4